MKICKHWIELDGYDGSLYEYCKKASKSCTCSGIKEQCNFPQHYKDEENKEKK